MSTASARSALRAGWGLEADAVATLREHWNDVYRVDVGTERYALRRHSPIYHDTPSIESELLWLDVLSTELAGRVPAPVPTRDGALVYRSDVGREDPRRLRGGTALDSQERWTLLRWVHGRAPGRMGPPTLARLGHLLAALHDHADRWRPPPTFRRPRIDIPSLGRSWFQPHDDRCWHGIADDVAKRLRAALESAAHVERELERSSPELFGLIHADLHRGNLLRAEGGLGALDFDDCAFGCRLYDLAVVLAGEQRTPSDDHGRALLRGYRERRRLAPELEPLLAAYVAARTVAVALFLNDWAQDHPAMAPRVRPSQRAAFALLDALGAGW